MRWLCATLAAAALAAGAMTASIACSEQVILGGIEPPPPPVCQDAVCGTACDPCPAGDAGCMAPPGHGCDGHGACVMAPSCQPPYDPCASKDCGAPCSPCAPGDQSCPPPMEPMACDAMNACVPAMGLLCPKMPPWMPCAQKTCGEPCTPCDPGQPKCQDMPGLACDPMGQCQPMGFACPGPPDGG